MLCYVRGAVSRGRQILRPSAPVALALSVGAIGAAAGSALIGCGGGERQDADETRSDHRVDVVRARFAPRQHIGRPETLAITVRNPGSKAIPGVSVTVRGFAERSRRTDQSDPRRPLWIVDEAPTGDESAYDDTWTTGALGPGARRTLRWRVTPVVPGAHEVDYAVAVGLDEGVAGDGSPARRPRGSLSARVTDRPARARVDPRTGGVVREGPPRRADRPAYGR